MDIDRIETDHDLHELFRSRGLTVDEHSELVVVDWGVGENRWYITELPDGRFAEWNDYGQQDYCLLWGSREDALSSSFEGFLVGWEDWLECEHEGQDTDGDAWSFSLSVHNRYAWVGPETLEYVAWLGSLAEEERCLHEEGRRGYRDQAGSRLGSPWPGLKPR